MSNYLVKAATMAYFDYKWLVEVCDLITVMTVVRMVLGTHEYI